MDRPNCYTCKYRGTVHGSAHSKCNILRDNYSYEGDIMSLEIMIATGRYNITYQQTGDPVVKINEYGRKNGWGMWPIDFDPTWVDECGFEHQIKSED